LNEKAYEKKWRRIADSEVISEEDLEWWEKENEDEYEITSKKFRCENCGQEYYVVVRHFHDGEFPDEMNTRVFIVKVKSRE